MKKILPVLLLLNSFTALYALEEFSFNDPVLMSLLEAQRTNSRAYAANEAFLESGNLQYDLSKSAVYPRIDLDLDGAGSNSFLSRIPDDPEDIELKNKYALSGTPEISFSQLLPTSGILSGSISDSLSASGIEESNSPLQPAEDTEYFNELSLTLGISQPIYFGNAYDAALTQMEETRAINRITYLDNRNSLIVSAATDYYNLVRAAYQQNLVKSRLETNSEYEKKMLREHSLGMWTQGQLNTAKATRLQSEADLLKASRALDAASDRIEALYGIKLVPLIDSEPIEKLPFGFSGPEIEALLSDNNPDNLINMKKIKIADSEITIKEKDSAWNFTVGGNYSLNSGITDDSFSDSLSLTLGISAPLADGGASASSLKLKEIEAQRLRNSYEEQLKLTKSGLQEQLNNLEVSEKLSEIYLLQEEAAIFDMEKGTRELELGGITQKDLLDLQIALENIRLSILVNRIEYNLTVLQIYRMAGTDLASASGIIGVKKK